MRVRVASMVLMATALLAVAGVATAAELDVTWAVRAGGPGHDKARGIAADRDGNVYLTGEFTGTAQFGEQSLSSRGDLDFFIAKFDGTGKCLWARSGGGSLVDRGYAVAVDRDQNCYVTGHYQSTDARFGAEGPLPNRGGYDVFVAKYDRTGELRWIRTGGSDGYDYGHGMGVDNAGNCYVTGGSPGAVEFGDLKTENQPGSRMFLWKLAPDGRTVWARASQGGGSSGQGMAVDGAGNAWVAGDASGEVEFGGARHVGSGRDAVVVKFDPAGHARWVAGGTDGKDGFGSAVSVDDSGAAYLSGGYKTTETLAGEAFHSAGEYDVLVAKIDASGKLVWARGSGGPGVDYCLGSASDGHGGCFVVGAFQEGAVFEGMPRHSEGSFDLYLAHYDGAGKLVEFRQGGGAGVDEAYCVARSGKAAYVSGAFSGSARYGDRSLTSAGSNDVVLLKVRLQ